MALDFRSGTFGLAAAFSFLALSPSTGAQTPEPSADTVVVTLPAPTGAAGSQPSWGNALEAAAPRSHGLIWKASNRTSTLYLLGSIHMASSDMYPLPQHIEEAFRRSDVLVVEVDLNKLDQSKFQSAFLAKGLYPMDDSLWNHISPETKNLVVRFCSENGMPAEGFARLKPWLATVMASTLPMQTSGMSPELGIDKHFLDLARNGMRVEQLETAELQLKLLADIPENKQEQYLAATVKSSAITQQIVKEFKTAWVTGDADKLDTLVSTAWQDAGGLQKKIFADRNPHMADVAEQCLKDNESCFMVVGAGHLVGKDGVVRMLQSRGYKVEQLFARSAPSN